MAAIVGRLALVLAAFLVVATAAELARLGAADPAIASSSVAASRPAAPAKDEARLLSEAVDGAPVSLVLLVTADGVVVERPAGDGGPARAPAALAH